MAHRKGLPCVYCQARPGNTKDHVPPKNIFAEPRPSNLITVNCCEDCNQSFKLDDEYLRAYIAVRADCLTANKRQVQEKAMRAFNRSPAFEAKFFQDVRVVEKVRADLSIDLVFQMRHDEDRLERIMKRIVRGIIWDHSKILLPLDSHWCVLLDHGYEPGIRAEIDKKTHEILEEEEAKEIGELFSYKFGMVDDRPNASIWQLRFFTELWCLVYVNLQDDLETASR
jgi:hypothetical protein